MKMLVPVNLTNPSNGRTIETVFRLDTGADISAVCTLIADNLKAVPIGTTYVRDAEGENIQVPVYALDLTVGDYYIGHLHMIGLNLRGTGYGGLLGMDVIEKGILSREAGSGLILIPTGATTYSHFITYSLGILIGVAGTLLLIRK